MRGVIVTGCDVVIILIQELSELDVTIKIENFMGNGHGLLCRPSPHCSSTENLLDLDKNNRSSVKANQG